VYDIRVDFYDSVVEMLNDLVRCSMQLRDMCNTQCAVHKTGSHTRIAERTRLIDYHADCSLNYGP
jgi:hypothetical protein